MSARDGRRESAADRARRMIRGESASCVLVRGGEIVFSASGRGVGPLLSLYENRPGLLRGSFAADRVVGKAAAMLLALGGAAGAWGEVMSETALRYLRERGLRAEYGRLVGTILGRGGKGLCPFERSVLVTEDPETGYRLIQATAARLQAGAQGGSVP